MEDACEVREKVDGAYEGGGERLDGYLLYENVFRSRSLVISSHIARSINT